MAIVINGSGTVTGLSVGGLPDGTVDSDTLASGIDKTSISDSGDANAITIDSDEKVGINTASPNTPFHAYNNGTSWVARVQQANAAGHGLIVEAASSSNTPYGIGLYNGSTFPFYVKQDGYIFSNTTINATNMTQKGGVDIVANGSNSNGNYFKFADGTMICTVSKSTSEQNNGATAGGFYYSNSGTWTYPVAFTGSVRVIGNTEGGHWNAISVKTPSVGNSSCTYATLSVNSTSNAQGLYLFAIGVWS